MPRWLPTTIACFVPALAQGQTVVEPPRLQAGTVVEITQPCAAPNVPALVLDGRAISALGNTPTWRFRLPATLEPKAYSARWQCGTAADGKELPHLGILEVQPVVPRVVGVSNAARDRRVAALDESKRNERARRDRLQDTLVVDVRNLAQWRQLGANKDLHLHLYLDGTELESVIARDAPPSTNDADVTRVIVTLDLDDGSEVRRKAWIHVLNAALQRSERTLPLTVGPTNAPFGSDVTIALDVFPSYTWVVAVMLGLTLLGVIALGKKSNLLRDATGAPNPPYSLAKHQMVVWFFVVIACYLYVWLITGTFSSISTTALTLIGISGATGLISITLDHNKRDEAITQRTALEAERAALHEAIHGPAGLAGKLAAAAAGAAGAAGSVESLQLSSAIAAKQARVNVLDSQLAAGPPAAPVNRRWYLDLLSDDTGVSFHRLQIAAWTVVLAAVFARAVIVDKLMPEFDATLLGLLGISSGTYLGFKFPLQK